MKNIQSKIIECTDMTLEGEAELLIKTLGFNPINTKKEFLEKLIIFENTKLNKKWVDLCCKTRYNIRTKKIFCFRRGDDGEWIMER